MYEKYDQGVQGSLGKFRNLLVCTIIVKSQEDGPIGEAKFLQKKRSTGYGSIHL